MSDLVGAADDSEADVVWTLSEDVADATEYFQVDDEVVRVIANFHSSIYAPTGLLTPPSIRVERGAGGTTAASHSDGATLTPVIPPSTGTGGAGETNVYVQPTDPGAVGAGKLWVDTTPDDDGQPSILRRNADDDGWDDILGDYVASGAVAVTSGAGAASEFFGGNGGVGVAGGYAGLGGGAGDDGADAGAMLTVEGGDGTGNAGGIVATGSAFTFNGDPVFAPSSNPEVPASPTEQDIVDALLALGLVTQAAP